LNVTVKSARGVVTLHCQGRLVRGQETALLCAVIQQHGRDIILDLSGVTAIDAAGIGVLVSLQADGTYLRLVDLSLAVLQTMRATSLDSVFEISESECSDSVRVTNNQSDTNRLFPRASSGLRENSSSDNV
jgi:anti-anti-sigma factor